MARPIDEFVLAWDALSGASTEIGWRGIPVAPAGPCMLMAGRRFPENEEALLAGFSTARLPVAEKLPEGRGFEICRADLHGSGKTWIALTRKESGSRELFAEMVGDVAGAMDAEAHAQAGEERLLRTLLGRVRSWQEFMSRGAQTLGPEAEIGLIGELLFLSALLEAGVPAPLAVEAWVGPLDASQDFVMGTGAVEVKATLSSVGFPAKIGSLEQLDDSVHQPLFVAGARLSRRESGRSLPEFVESVRDKLDDEAGRLFADRLLAAGYHDSHSDRYPRRSALEGMRVVEVADGFPRIVPGNVPDGIRNVVYEIDLDRALGDEVSLIEALKKLGAF